MATKRNSEDTIIMLIKRDYAINMKQFVDEVWKHPDFHGNKTKAKKFLETFEPQGFQENTAWSLGYLMGIEEALVIVRNFIGTVKK